MDGGDWISLAGVVISGASAVWAVVSARKASAAEKGADDHRDKALQQAKKAIAAAEKAAAAEVETAAAAQRAAGALEEQNKLATEQAAAEEGVPWRVYHRKGATWELRNASAYPKWNVEISGPGVSTKNPPGDFDLIQGHSSVEFWGTTTYGAQMRVNVTWHQLGYKLGDPLNWSGMMPPSN
jgi:hypothetical protein